MHTCRRKSCRRKTSRRFWCSVSCWMADVIDNQTEMTLEQAFSLEKGSIFSSAEADLIHWAADQVKPGALGMTKRRIAW